MRKTLPLFTLVLFLAACATNPATGKREFNIVSESQEVAIGQQSHPEIVRQFGIYDEKPELTRLVQRIGSELAAKSERPNLPWTFTLLDTPMVNAMALPGGYIYVTRGMLERINSEDELAGVIGHEIAHVTARHAAQQISRTQLAQLGLVLGAAIAGPQAAQQYGQLAELGLGLLFQKYSRGQETQADLLGTGYMAEARFNPIGAERMLMALQRLDKNPANGIDRYFLSHPEPAKRVRDVQKKIVEIQGMASAGSFNPPNRTEYVRMLDGMITANATEHTVIKDGVIYDRDHGLIVRAPADWTASMQPGVMFALSPSRGNSTSYLVAQEVEAKQLQGRDAQDAIRGRLQQMGLTYAGSRNAETRTGQRFPIDVWSGQTQSGVVGVETTQFVHGDHVAVLMFVSPSVSASNSPLATVLQQTDINVARARSVAPPRIRIGITRAGDTWASLARRATGSERAAETVANMNGYDLSTPPPAGLTVKLPEDVIPES